MEADIDTLIEELGEPKVSMLLMETNIEERIQIDKDHSGDDWRDLYDGECSKCGRLWESDFMMPFGTQKHCIPCWRKKNDLPKLDPDDFNLS